jgi:protein gp37
MNKTSIEWTDATWNPTTGCTKVSPGCLHCYIDRTPPFRMAGRKFVKGKIPIELHENRLDAPLKWKKPRMIFVNSLSDLFHEDIPDEFIDKVFAAMALAKQHTFQVLTKRPQRMMEYCSQAYMPGAICDAAILMGHAEIVKREWKETDCGVYRKLVGPSYPLPNVWIGVTCEDQKRADERIPLLLQTPAAVRFLSCEPLIGPVDLSLGRKRWRCSSCGNVGTPAEEIGMGRCPCGHELDEQKDCGIDWIIGGGESGPGARPMNPNWARSLRDQSQAAGVAYHFKQWGEWVDEFHPAVDVSKHEQFDGFTTPIKDASGQVTDYQGQYMFRVGKHAAGRLLDGRTWDEFPQQKSATN